MISHGNITFYTYRKWVILKPFRQKNVDRRAKNKFAPLSEVNTSKQKELINLISPYLYFPKTDHIKQTGVCGPS